MPANVTHNMDVARSYGVAHKNAYEYSLSLAGAGNSEVILIPADISTISVQVIPSGGASGKVQTTCSKIQTVKDGNETWEDWVYGAVTSEKTGVSDPVTAIRLVQGGTGATILNVRAQ